MSCAASRNMLQLHCCCRCLLWMMRERPSSSLTRSMAQKQRTARFVDGVLQLLRWSQSILLFAGLRHEKDSTLVSSVCPYSDRQSCITHPWPWKSPLEGKFFRGEANPGDLVLGAHELLWTKKRHSSNHFMNFMNFMYFSDFRLPTRSIPAQQNVHQSHNCVNLDAGWTPETCSTSRDIENRRSPDKYPHYRYLRSEATCLVGGKGGPQVIPNILMISISCFGFWRACQCTANLWMVRNFRVVLMIMEERLPPDTALASTPDAVSCLHTSCYSAPSCSLQSMLHEWPCRLYMFSYHIISLRWLGGRSIKSIYLSYWLWCLHVKWV